MKLSRGNTAERHVAHPRLLRKRKAGAVTGGERLLIRHGGLAGEKRSDGVQNIPAGKIECGRDLCLPDCLAVPLPLHQLRTGKAELNPGIGVNGVVDTAVTGAEAPEQLAVGGVDNGVALQRGDVALPQVNAGFQRGKVGDIGDLFLRNRLLQIFVLNLQKFLSRRFRLPEIEKTAQKSFPCRFSFGRLDAGKLRDFLLQCADQPDPPFFLCHAILPFGKKFYSLTTLMRSPTWAPLTASSTMAIA